MNVAIIPARGGSRGIPRKNLRVLCGRPLLVWSIDAALACKRIDRVVVSTEDEEIATVAGQAGAEVLARSPALATDDAPTDAVVVDAIEQLGIGDRDLLVLLQPTVPVRRPGLIEECVAWLGAKRAESAHTAYPLHFVWWREWVHPDTDMNRDQLWRSQCPRRPTRQHMSDRELMWHEDGSVYVTPAWLLRQNGTRISERPEIIENERTVDIDTEDDFAMAAALLRARMEAAQRRTA